MTDKQLLALRDKEPKTQADFQALACHYSVSHPLLSERFALTACLVNVRKHRAAIDAKEGAGFSKQLIGALLLRDMDLADQMDAEEASLAGKVH